MNIFKIFKKKSVPTFSIEMWVARDYDGAIFVYTVEPYRGDSCWHANNTRNDKVRGKYMMLDDSEDIFANLTWADNPMKVLLTNIQK